MRLLGEAGKTAIALGLGFAVASCAPADRVTSADASGSTISIQSPTKKRQGANDRTAAAGPSFSIDGITYTPTDTVNYDKVGYATTEVEPATGITASHRTLPIPSYAEVTSLDTGRTILVRIERRGPMVNSRLISLSSDAMAQLGGGEGAPVRVRRVNPTEEQRVELRFNDEALVRTETSAGLLDVLQRKLPAVGSASLRRKDGSPVPGIGRATHVASSMAPASARALQPENRATGTGSLVVQAGAFTASETAKRIALRLDGYVEGEGRQWNVRVGPFATRGQAQATLAKVRGAGYRGAQLHRIR